MHLDAVCAVITKYMANLPGTKLCSHQPLHPLSHRPWLVEQASLQHCNGLLSRQNALRDMLPLSAAKQGSANHAWLPRQKPMQRRRDFLCCKEIASRQILPIPMRLCSTSCVPSSLPTPLVHLPLNLT